MEEKEKNIEETSVEEPKEVKGGEKKPFDPLLLLARIDTLERSHKLLNDGIEFVKGTNQFILAVLFMGFVAILFSFWGLMIQANNTSANTQIELINSMGELKNTVDNLNHSVKIQYLTITPTPTP